MSRSQHVSRVPPAHLNGHSQCFLPPSFGESEEPKCDVINVWLTWCEAGNYCMLTVSNLLIFLSNDFVSCTGSRGWLLSYCVNFLSKYSNITLAIYSDILTIYCGYRAFLIAKRKHCLLLFIVSFEYKLLFIVLYKNPFNSNEQSNMLITPKPQL